MPVTPYPFENIPDVMVPRGHLDVSLKVENDNGLWIELNDGAVFRLADGSFDGQATQWRRTEVSNPFIEGTFITNALRENITERVNVYVQGQTVFECKYYTSVLKTAVSQIRFQAELTIEDARVMWNCYASDYTVESNRPLLHSRMCLVKIDLIRDPVEQLLEDI
jgi:hypothetical protein